MDERSAYIALNMMQQVGPVSVRALSESLGSVSGILDADDRSLRSVPGVSGAVVAAIMAQRGKLDPAVEEARASEAGARIVARNDEEYPASLKEIHDPPMALYVKGSFKTTDRRAIAVVGTRHPTHYGSSVAERISMQLAAAGFTVISGLATGTDTAAHRGALKGNGRTIAVLGGAIDCLYPPENRDLGDDISRHGAVISEYPMGREPDRTTFPVRNRIVSGLSMGVLVIEAGRQSGAMITASQAGSQGRQVFAVPGRIDNPRASGCHDLIRNGAVLVTSVDDVLEEFEFLIPRRETVAAGSVLSETDKRLMDLLAEGERDVDALIRQSGMQASSVNAVLLSLEMRHLVRMLPGRLVARA